VDLFVDGSGDARMPAPVDRALRETLGAWRTARVSASDLGAAEAAPLRWFGGLLGMEGWVLLAIAALGTFAVMHLWVRSLWYELGVRRAVGARRREILAFVLRRALGVAGGGVAIGLWLGLSVWGALATVVAGLPEWDWQTALRIAPLLVAATLAGALVPAWLAAAAAPTTLATVA
jgi:putative ABC transport system permease protein